MNEQLPTDMLLNSLWNTIFPQWLIVIGLFWFGWTITSGTIKGWKYFVWQPLKDWFADLEKRMDALEKQQGGTARNEFIENIQFKNLKAEIDKLKRDIALMTQEGRAFMNAVKDEDEARFYFDKNEDFDRQINELRLWMRKHRKMR